MVWCPVSPNVGNFKKKRQFIIVTCEYWFLLLGWPSIFDFLPPPFVTVDQHVVIHYRLLFYSFSQKSIKPGLLHASLIDGDLFKRAEVQVEGGQRPLICVISALSCPIWRAHGAFEWNLLNWSKCGRRGQQIGQHLSTLNELFQQTLIHYANSLGAETSVRKHLNLMGECVLRCRISRPGQGAYLREQAWKSKHGSCGIAHKLKNWEKASFCRTPTPITIERVIWITCTPGL
jgi:hypothetical protein